MFKRNTSCFKNSILLKPVTKVVGYKSITMASHGLHMEKNGINQREEKAF